MSELTSVDKLRGYMLYDSGDGLSAIIDSDEIADEIECEVSERFIELPMDKNGEPWTLDTEEFLDDTGNMLCFSGLRVNIKGEWLVQSNCTWLDPHDCLRIRSRTIEDVLYDFMVCGLTIDEAAAELRGMMEADE